MDAASPADARPRIWKEILTGQQARTVIGADIVSYELSETLDGTARA